MNHLKPMQRLRSGEEASMKTIMKYAAAAAMTGALALAAATPSQARDGAAIAAGAGFAAGAVVGAAAANNAYYGPGYYGPGYGPADYGDYAYEPAPAYYGPAPRYYNGGYRYRTNEDNCAVSPSSGAFSVCNNYPVVTDVVRAGREVRPYFFKWPRRSSAPCRM
jgi:hypothetical protein